MLVENCGCKGSNECISCSSPICIASTSYQPTNTGIFFCQPLYLVINFLQCLGQYSHHYLLPLTHPFSGLSQSQSHSSRAVLLHRLSPCSPYHPSFCSFFYLPYFLPACILPAFFPCHLLVLGERKMEGKGHG